MIFEGIFACAASTIPRVSLNELGMCQTPRLLVIHLMWWSPILQYTTAWEPWAMFPYSLPMGAALYLPWAMFGGRLSTNFCTCVVCQYMTNICIPTPICINHIYYFVGDIWTCLSGSLYKGVIYVSWPHCPWVEVPMAVRQICKYYFKSSISNNLSHLTLLYQAIVPCNQT